MKLHPPSVEEKLGFDVLRERLEENTRSRLGQDRLARMRPATKLEWVETELARVAELQQAFRFDDPVPLEHVLDIRSVIRRAAPEGAYVDPEDLLAVGLVLRTLRLLKAYFGGRRARYPRLAHAVGRITPLQPIEARIAEVVDENGSVRDDASPELRRLRSRIVLRQGQLRETLLAELRRAVSQGYATEEQPTIRGGRMVIPVRAEAKRKVQGFVQDVSSTGQTVYIEPAAVLDLNNEIRELQSEERREVERILKALTARLREHDAAMRDNVRALGQFDLLQAKARLANDLDAVVPRLTDAPVLAIERGRNPALVLHFRRQADAAAEGGERREVVPLDLTLGRDVRTLVITGPNAGGKTVAMKTAGLLALMLAYGLPVPVDERSEMGLFDRLIVDLGDQQSMEEDLSTFTSHVENLKFMLRHAGERALVLIDEAGTGTDPAEGGALAQAVLERLTEVRARTIATTHHGTLKAFAHDTEGVENGSMQFDAETLSPTYRFQTGIPGSSYAFEIASRIGLRRDVLDRARALAGEQKTALEDLIATFEARRAAVDEELETARTARRAAERERDTYAGRAEKLRRERDEIRTQALREAERIVGTANARVERTIREIKEAQAERDATKEARAALERFKESLARRKARDEDAAEPDEPADDSGAEKARPASGDGAPAKKRSAKRRGRRPEPAPPATGPIEIGDQVVVDGGTTAGEVVELEDREAVVVLGSMRMRVKQNRLQKVGGKRKQQVTVGRVQASGPSDLAAVNARTSVDLRGQRVEEALHAVDRLIDDALTANLDRVEILHGKGTGALRAAIREYLSARPEVADLDDAPVDQGGAGITVVHLT